MKETNEILKRWIKKADHDLGTAILTQKHIPEYKDTIAFHCQQAVEKYLKSIILKLGLQIKKTHDLVFLLEQISEHEHIDHEWFEKVFELQDFAIEIRYPDFVIELEDEDIYTAIESTKLFREMTLKKIGLEILFDYPDKDSGS